MSTTRKKLDKSKVEELAELFCTNEEIATILGCTVGSLERACARELKRGRTKGKAELRKKQWQSVLDGNITMQVWFGKQFLCQSDKIENSFNEDQYKELLAAAHATMVQAAGAGRATSGHTTVQN